MFKTRFAMLALGATLFTPALFGGACTVGTLQSYQTGANFDCTYDGYTVDFDNGILAGSDGFSATGVNQLTSSEIIVTPTSTDTSFTFEFSAATNYLFAGQPGGNTYDFDYTLDPAVPRIAGTSINTGPSDPVTLTGEFCGNSLIISPSACSSGGSYQNYGITGSSGTVTSANYLFPTVQTDMETELTLVLDPCEYVDNFGSTVNLVPEPSTLWLTPGLLGIVWLGKKRLANKAARS